MECGDLQLLWGKARYWLWSLVEDPRGSIGGWLFAFFSCFFVFASVIGEELDEENLRVQVSFWARCPSSKRTPATRRPTTTCTSITPTAPPPMSPLFSKHLSEISHTLRESGLSGFRVSPHGQSASSAGRPRVHLYRLVHLRVLLTVHIY